RTLLVEQLTAPVKFAQAAGELVSQGVTTFVEVGPGNVLSGLLKRIDSSVRAIPVNDLPPWTPPPANLPESFGSLDGKRALVTGGSRGIGAAIARELASAGADVVVGYRAGGDEAESVATEIGGSAVQADVSSAEDAARLVDAAGDIDV